MSGSTPAAYGGVGWSPRTQSMREELGSVWAACGLDSEWRALRSVLLHRPGRELEVADADAAQMLEPPDSRRAAAQHDDMADAYRAADVDVHYVEPLAAQPNQLFCADLFVMTPAGALIGRPASTVRAGEERWIARRLADLGIPILRSIGGHGTFEGADLMWLDEQTAMIGRGLRTNEDGARQVAAALTEIGARAVLTDVARHAMHLMGQLRIVDRDLALVRSGMLPDSGIRELRRRGFEVHSFPEQTGTAYGYGHNFVVLAPRRIIMPAGYPVSQRFYDSLGIECTVVGVDELGKAAGSIGCMTGVLQRDTTGV